MKLENVVCKVSAIVSLASAHWKDNQQYSNWSCDNLVVDDANNVSGVHSPWASFTVLD